MPFESFVRPYQSPGALRRTIIAATPGATKDRAHLTWGVTSDAKITRTREGFNVECCKKTIKQTDHKNSDFENVTIEAPAGGPSDGQKVEFQRANKLAFDSKHTNSCISDWDQMSGVAFGVSEALAEFEADMSFAGDGTTDETCKMEWSLTNTPTGRL
jgi:O-succinylbenzoate synthase